MIISYDYSATTVINSKFKYNYIYIKIFRIKLQKGVKASFLAR